jgi:hypothetical protein
VDGELRGLALRGLLVQAPQGEGLRAQPLIRLPAPSPACGEKAEAPTTRVSLSPLAGRGYGEEQRLSIYQKIIDKTKRKASGRSAAYFVPSLLLLNSRESSHGHLGSI